MKKALAIDLGGTKTAVGLINEKLQIVEKASFYTPSSPSQAVEKIKEIAARMDPEEKINAGISICGLLSINGKKLLIAPNIKWENIDTSELFKPLNRTFRVLNDGTAAAWASYNMEKEAATKRLLSMTLGTGVGGGLVIDGRIMTGAAELGHVKTDSRGPLCGCGSRGCLETIAGGNFLPARARQWEGLEVKSARALFELARKGNEKAIRVWKKMGSELGYFLSGVVNMTGVQEIIIGGRIVQARKYFFENLKKEINAGVMASEIKKCRVKIAKSKHNLSLIGAAAAVLIPED